MISLHWRGKPMTDIETVVGYIRETTTSGGLTVECWFDKKKYLTVEEKKELGLYDEIMTKDQLALTLEGRIVHAYDSDSDLYRWHYTIFPEHVTDEVLAAERGKMVTPDELEEAAKAIKAIKLAEEAAKAAKAAEEADSARNAKTSGSSKQFAAAAKAG